MKKILLILTSALLILLSSCGNKEYDTNLSMVPSKLNSAIEGFKKLEAAHCELWDALVFDFNAPYNLVMSNKGTISQERYIQGVADQEQNSFFAFDNLVSDSLKNPPSNRKECYDDLVKIEGEMCMVRQVLCNMSSSPMFTHDVNTYKQNVDSKIADVQKSIYAFNTKYSDILNSDN